MRAFGIFSIIAALSTALSVSAAPVASNGLNLAPPAVAQNVNFPGSLSNLPIPAGVPAPPRRDVTPFAARGDIKSVPEILVDVTAQVKVVVDKLDVVLAGQIDVTVVVGLLLEIKGIFIAALAEVKALVGLKLDVILCLDGKVLAVADLAVYVVALLELIVVLIVKVQGLLSATIVIQACIDICVALSAFLGAIFAIVGGLLVIVLSLCAELIIVIKAHATIFVSLIAVLGL